MSMDLRTAISTQKIHSHHGLYRIAGSIKSYAARLQCVNVALTDKEQGVRTMAMTSNVRTVLLTLAAYLFLGAIVVGLI